MTLLEAQQHPLHLPAHPNTTLGAVMAKDPGYVDWLAGQSWPDFVLAEAVSVLRAHHGRTAVPKPQPRTDRRQMSLL